MPRKTCALCRGPLCRGDRHIICASCLGREHAEAALAKGGCPEFDEEALSTLRARLAFFTDDPTPSDSVFPALVPSKKKRPAPRMPEHTAVSEPTLGQSPHASLSSRDSPSLPVSSRLELQMRRMIKMTVSPSLHRTLRFSRAHLWTPSHQHRSVSMAREAVLMQSFPLLPRGS